MAQNKKTIAGVWKTANRETFSKSSRSKTRIAKKKSSYTRSTSESRTEKFREESQAKLVSGPCGDKNDGPCGFPMSLIEKEK